MAFSILIVFYLSQKDIWKYIVFVMCIQRDGSQKWKVAQPIKGSLSEVKVDIRWTLGSCVWNIGPSVEHRKGVRAHITHTHTHTHTHSPPLEGHADKLFPSCSAVLVLRGSKHHSTSFVLSRRAMLTPALCELSVFIRHVQFFTITITYLLLRVVKHSIHVPNENSVLCF